MVSFADIANVEKICAQIQRTYPLRRHCTSGSHSSDRSPNNDRYAMVRTR